MSESLDQVMSHSSPQPLDPLRLPLQGSQLIEASAGTGKTWTIAALFLRLVLGHGAVGPGRPLLPAEILVMTFTRAATRELSDRIRQRLVDAAACFRGEQAPAPQDHFLAELLADYPDDDTQPGGSPRAAAAWRLAMAAESMDDAAVHTIDAWCQRMLREHAFDSGSLFDEELQANPAAMLSTAVHDYWRQQVYPLPPDVLQHVLATWRDVDALLKFVRGLVDLPLPADAGEGSLQARVEAAAARRRAAVEGLKEGWLEVVQEMRRWLELELGRKDCALNRQKLQPRYYEPWLKALAEWAGNPGIDVPSLSDAAITRLKPSGMREAVKPGQRIEIPAVFDRFADLMLAVPHLQEVAPGLQAHAVARVAQRVQFLKAQAGSFGFADMLNRLDDALDDSRHGEKAQRLRQRILQQHPVALVDEFQDTSPVQLRIFDRLYRIADNEASRALLMIGDPKQAIYSFRGADILSYLQARRATAGRHHVLGTNHRSSVALVQAVNGCFLWAEAREGGAFGLRDEQGGQDDLPFVPVAAQGRPERLVIAGEPTAPLTLWLNAELQSMGDSREHLAAVCAEQIVQLLNDAHTGFERSDKLLQRLRPADVAVLVRTGREAVAVQAALRRRGVASVYLSDKDSVLASDEAADVLRLLQAVAEPRQVRLARTAFATGLMGLSLDELLQLAQDDEAFDARCELLAQLQAVWQGQGVLAMLRRALHAFDLPARWLSGSAPEAQRAIGERRMTNVLHLAELLQAASASVEGEAGLLRWLAEQIEAATSGSAGVADEQVQRLESDADLVQVVTVHKSKGLEYPLVFLPYASQFRAVEAHNTPVVFLPGADGSDGSDERQLCFAPGPEAIEAAERERLREDLRLLYVALTRARHALWVGAAALKRGNNETCLWHRSALGQLVSGREPRTPGEMAADVHGLAAQLPGVHVQSLPSAGVPLTRLQARGQDAPLQPAPVYQGRFDRSWSISSYSALVKDLQGDGRSAPAPVADSPPRLLRDDEPVEADAVLPARGLAALSDQAWHRFPRGALAGNFLHTQLEWLAEEGFALQEQPQRQQALLRRCERQGWGHRADDVLAWMLQVCSTPLPALGTALQGLDRCLPEMEFWLPSDGLRAEAVDRLCRQHILPGRARPALPERALHGLLMGFADLVFEHQGRWGVLDHKSNALGVRDADYTPAAMEAAMLEHRYDVQAALYLLALHRLLRARLGAAYAPGRDLHGAVYLFLRGIHGGSAGCFHLPPPVPLIEALDAMLSQPVPSAS